ncbi:MAG: endo-1,4-beta-xylanase [Oscillospiraceae bacterium]|nr:endo-1,4-beta-xylanase [Oscillospiraceae bacterium]
MHKTLKEAFSPYFTVGAAVSAHWIDEARDVVAENFDTVTCENEMKYLSVHPHGYEAPRDVNAFNRGEIEFRPEIADRESLVHPSLVVDTSGADKIANFARENGLKIRGHNLAWHASYPWGVFERLSPSELRSNLDEHFKLMAEKYGDCYCWDVVNEAMNDRREGGDLRNNIFHEKLGDDYLFELHRLARKYFPQSELCLNDYSEFRPDKRDRIIRTAMALKERDLVDVIGLQCHTNIGVLKHGFDGIRRSMDMYASTGLKLHITEMDVSCVDWHEGPKEITPEMISDVAEVYEKYFEIFKDYSEYIENVTLWGVSNKHSWLNFMGPEAGRGKNKPLLFDDEYRATESLERLLEMA